MFDSQNCPRRCAVVKQGVHAHPTQRDLWSALTLNWEPGALPYRTDYSTIKASTSI